MNMVLSRMGAMFMGFSKTNQQPTRTQECNDVRCKVPEQKIVISEDGILDFSKGDVFEVDAKNGKLKLNFINLPKNKALFVSIRIIGIGPIEWPSDVQWDEGYEPKLGSSYTIIMLSFIRGSWYGQLSHTK